MQLYLAQQRYTGKKLSNIRSLNSGVIFVRKHVMIFSIKWFWKLGMGFSLMVLSNLLFWTGSASIRCVITKTNLPGFN